MTDLDERLDIPRPAIMRAPGISPDSPGIVQPDYLEIHTKTHALWLGFISAHTATGVISLKPDWNRMPRLTLTQPLGPVSLRPGQYLRLDTWCLIDGQASDALGVYAALSAHVMRGKKNDQRHLGWCSWYHYFENIRAEDVLENLEQLTDPAHGTDCDIVLLDDGYQQAVGDWLMPNPRFDGHPEAIAQAITQTGRIPGLWLAPFCVSANAQLAHKQPNWLIRDPTGNPINHFTHWGHQPTYALDLTHPDAIAHLRHTIHTMTHLWGYRYLKLDFLYAGAIHGLRHNPSITPIQAYRNGLRHIAEAAGPSVILNGCGAPMLASVGLVDSMRTGSDTAHHWHSKPPGNCEPGALNAMRGVLARYWMNGRYWVNDPDCAIVGNLTLELSDAEIQTMLTVIALSGGNIFASDRLSTLSRHHRQWLHRTLFKQPHAASPLTADHQGVPTALYLKLDKTSDAIARFNWTDQAYPWQYHPNNWPDYATFAHPHHLLDAWTNKPTLISQSHPTHGLTIPPHGVSLLLRRQVQPQTHLLATSHTLLGGYPFTFQIQYQPTSIRLSTPQPFRHPATAILAIANTTTPFNRDHTLIIIKWPAQQTELSIPHNHSTPRNT